MKKMKRFLVAMLGGLTAIACLAGVSACKKDKASKETVQQPNYDININYPSVEVEKCVHDYSVVYAEKAATCDEDGYSLIGCSKCGDRLTDTKETIPALGHEYEAVEAKDATCTEKGYVAYEACKTCGDKKGFAETKANGHTYSVAATCTTPAACKCGATDPDQPALGHTMVYVFDVYVNNSKVVDGWISTEADYKTLVDSTSHLINKTCTTDGMKQFKICTACSIGTTAYKNEATKTQDGKIAWAGLSTLEKLEAYLADENVYVEGFEAVPASHNMVDYFAATATKNAEGEYIAATCTTKGLKNFKVCKDCDKNDVATTAATTYAAVEALVTVAANAPAGTTAQVYAEGFEIATTDALGHNYVTAAGVNTYKAGVDATCTENGYTEEYTCQRTGCNHAQTKQTLTATGHDGAAGNPAATVATASTFTNAASKVAVCGAKNYCGNCMTYWGDEGAHDPKYITRASTCVEDGYAQGSWYCDDCDAKYYVVDPRDGHAFTGLEISKSDATCLNPGLNAHYVCQTAGCGAVATATEVNGKTVFSVTTKTALVHTAAKGHTYKVNGADRIVNGYELCNLIVNDIAKWVAASTETDKNTCSDFTGTYTCTVCSTAAYIGSGHVSGAWFVDAMGYPVAEANAAVLADGSKAKYNGFSLTAATCTKAAFCNLCKESVGAAKLHEFIADTETNTNNFIEERPATCTQPGVRGYYVCTRGCGVVALSAGTYTTGSIVKDANGNQQEVTLSTVGTLLAIKPYGHTMVDVAKKVPTCTEVGYEAHKACADCGLKEGYKAIAATGHKSSAEGSCATIINCDACGLEINNPKVQPDNHHWNANNGECDCCKLVCAHPSYKNGVCTVCKKQQPAA